jgi:hypothetical protein
MPPKLILKVFGISRLILTAKHSRDLRVTFVAVFVLLVGILALLALGIKSEATINQRNNLFAFEAESPSRTKMIVRIRYRYSGDRGDNNICILASALDNDGSQHPATRSTLVPVRVGQGIATLDIRKYNGPCPGVSERVKVCLQEGTGRPFYCQTFPYTKSWAYNLPGQPPRYNEVWGFHISPPGPHGNLVRVHYAYTGDHGQDGVRMVAFAFQRNLSQVPGTYPVPAEIKPGYGSITLKIRQKPGYASAPREKTRVCMITPEGKAFMCEDFWKLQ